MCTLHIFGEQVSWPDEAIYKWALFPIEYFFRLFYSMKSRAIFGLMMFCNFSMKHCSIYPRRKLFDLYKEITPWLSQGVLFLLTTMAFNFATAINNLESFHALSSWSLIEWLVTMKHTGDSFVQSWDKDPMVISPSMISLFITHRSHLLTEHSGATPFLAP